MNIISLYLAPVKLTGGKTSREGTVYVWNKQNQRYEGVCDDSWDM